MSLPRWLSTLISLRRQDRDHSRQRLDEALQAVSVLGQKDQALAAEAVQITQLRREAAASGRCDLNRLLAAQRHQATLELERRTVAQQSELLEQEVERRRRKLAEAEQQLRMLERLSERKQEQVRREAFIGEAKRLDELASAMQHTEGDL